MGEAKRRKQASSAGQPWPSDATGYRGQIELHLLPPIATIDTTRIRDLTGDENFPLGKQVSLNAFRAVVGDREFHVGFCLGDGERFSGIGLAVIDRLLAEEGDAPVFVVPIIDQEVAWDIVLRHLSTFAGKILVFAFANSTVYDAGTAEIYYAREIAVFREGERMRRLTEEDRRRVKARAAAIKGEPAPLPRFYQMPCIDRHEQPWIFELKASTGKVLRLTAWNGRKDFIHEFPSDIINLVGGNRIAIVQVGSPVGVGGRSSVALSDVLAKDFDGIVHWARDTETYQSILRELVLANLPSVSPPPLRAQWDPEITLMPVND